MESITKGSSQRKNRVGRFARIVAFVLCLALGAIAVAAWVADDQREIPFDYEGFD